MLRNIVCFYNLAHSAYNLVGSGNISRDFAAHLLLIIQYNTSL